MLLFNMIVLIINKLEDPQNLRQNNNLKKINLREKEVNLSLHHLRLKVWLSISKVMYYNNNNH